MTEREQQLYEALEAMVSLIDSLPGTWSEPEDYAISSARKLLREANGAGGDEWRAVIYGSVGSVWNSDDQPVALDIDPRDARRIASDHNRLPKLERAARKVLQRWPLVINADADVKALRAALSDKEPGQ